MRIFRKIGVKTDGDGVERDVVAEFVLTDDELRSAREEFNQKRVIDDIKYKYDVKEVFKNSEDITLAAQETICRMDGNDEISEMYWNIMDGVIIDHMFS